MEENSDKGFTIKDRRKISLDDVSSEPAGAEEKSPESAFGEAQAERQAAEAKERFDEASRKHVEKDRVPLPEVTFSTFVLSLSSSALVHLGEIPDPNSQKTDPDLQMAKQIIDTLGMLQEKTEGNLDQEEDRLLKTLLYDLRLRYVQKCGR